MLLITIVQETTTRNNILDFLHPVINQPLMSFSIRNNYFHKRNFITTSKEDL